jgi:hypothetical protein
MRRLLDSQHKLMGEVSQVLEGNKRFGESNHGLRGPRECVSIQIEKARKEGGAEGIRKANAEQECELRIERTSELAFKEECRRVIDENDNLKKQLRRFQDRWGSESGSVVGSRAERSAEPTENADSINGTPAPTLCNAETRHADPTSRSTNCYILQPQQTYHSDSAAGQAIAALRQPH